MLQAHQSSRWRKTRAALLAILALGAPFATVMIAGRSWASDHDDAPSLTSDKGVDIADVFAFMRPGGGATHMTLAMTVHPDATVGTTTTFDTGVEYIFRIASYDPATGSLDTSVDVQIACRFQSPSTSSASQLVLCAGNGISAFATVGLEDAGAPNDALRIYAGVRADPAFGDVAALKSTLANKEIKLTDAGTNTFAGKNVLALVVEVDVDRVILGTDAGPRPLLAVSGTTRRL